MTALTATERGALADELLPVAGRLVCIIRGDGNDRDIHQLLARLEPSEKDALLVVLAAMVNPDMPISLALSYITWDEYGRSTPPPDDDRTMHDLDQEWWDNHWVSQNTPALPAGCGPQTVRIVEDTAELARQGCTREQIIQRLGLGKWNTVTAAHLRMGVPLPSLPVLRNGVYRDTATA